MSTADAVSREAAFLSASDDGLPNLLASASPAGPWTVVQAYWTRTPRTQVPSIFVTRARIADSRAASQRIRPGYQFRLKLVWPVRQTAAGLLETEQQALDDAVDLLVQRIRGPLGDKSHGGRFLSAGETPGRPPAVSVEFADPEQTMGTAKELQATVLYSIDDYEVNG